MNERNSYEVDDLEMMRRDVMMGWVYVVVWCKYFW